MEHFPLTPVEEEGRLHDPVLRENFIERIFTCKRYCDLVEGKNRVAGLLDFHTRNKLLLMAHSPKHLREMGALVAHTREIPVKDLIDRYETLLMEAMALKPSTAKHVNVLQHIMGYFKKQLASDEKQELLEVINDYKRGLIPLIVPVTLLAHYVRKYNQAYLKEQTYLNPHPAELMLRNHV
ncbi:MAG TPA: YbgA family protein [Syntrophales bacterium]|nr:YbgA family protein [Syntrophales bacterium]